MQTAYSGSGDTVPRSQSVQLSASSKSGSEQRCAHARASMCVCMWGGGGGGGRLLDVQGAPEGAGGVQAAVGPRRVRAGRRGAERGAAGTGGPAAECRLLRTTPHLAILDPADWRADSLRGSNGNLLFSAAMWNRASFAGPPMQDVAGYGRMLLPLQFKHGGPSTLLRYAVLSITGF